MKSLVVFDGRFYYNGGIPSSYHLTYELFTKRYFAEFESVIVVGRLFLHDDLIAKPVVGEGADFIGIPGYVGPKSFLLKLPLVIKTLWNLNLEDTAIFLRTPGTIPFVFSLILLLKRKKFVVEVVADPYDQLGKGSVNHPIRWFFQKLYTYFLKFQCKKAIAAAYVTKYALQRRYPPDSDITTHYTSLNLGNEWFIDSPRKYKKKNEYRLLNVGMMVQLYKAQDIILLMLNVLNKRNFRCTVTLIGDGEYKGYLEEMAKNLGVFEQVNFLGKVSDRVLLRKYYDDADLFILPSRQEGLPRVLIEAMVRALPCVATDVGGVSELLDDTCIIKVNDVEGLANKVEWLCLNSEVWEAHSERNLKIADDYRGDIVQARRSNFYKKVIQRYNEK